MKNPHQVVNLLDYQIENKIGSLVEHNKMAATSSCIRRPLCITRRVNNACRVSLYRVGFNTQKQSMTLAHPATYKQQCNVILSFSSCLEFEM